VLGDFEKNTILEKNGQSPNSKRLSQQGSNMDDEQETLGNKTFQKRSQTILTMISGKGKRHKDNNEMSVYSIDSMNMLGADGNKTSLYNSKLILNNNTNLNNLPSRENQNDKDSVNNLNTLPVIKSSHIKPTIVHDEIDEESLSQDYKIQDKANTETLKKILSFKEHGYKLNFSFCEIAKHFFFPCCKDKKIRHKFKLYKKSEMVLDEVLDMSYIVQKLDEFDKLKSLILTNEQVALFNFISKDVVSLDSDRQQRRLSSVKEFTKDQENLAITIIKFMRNFSKENDEEKIPEIDKKIFELLHDEVKKELLASGIREI
jgi:hypothetical protein